MRPEPVLRLDHVTKRYGALTVTNDVSIQVPAGQRRALIGPNGAGKTTLFNLISGRVPLSEGSIWLRGADITKVREEVRARRGIGRTFQHSELFTSVDAVQNVVMALRRRGGTRMPILPSRRDTALREEARDLLRRVGLDPDSQAEVGAMAHGQRRQLEVAMALAQDPVILLFDEPTAGMSAAETETFQEVFRSLPEELAVVLIEHDLDVVFSLASEITVLAAGAVIFEGAPEHVRASPVVQDAYLGTNLEGVFR